MREIIYVLSFFLFFSYPLKSFAVNYYCDYISGSNSNFGTKSSPWKTPPGTYGDTGTGWVKLGGGDTVYLKGGDTYPIFIDVSSTNYSNGSSGNYVTIASGHLDTPVWGTSTRAKIDGASTRKFGIFISGITYMKITGLEVTGQTGLPRSGVHPGGGPSAIECDSSSNYLWVVDNICHDVNRTSGSDGAYGIEINNSTYALIEKNVTYNCAEKGIEIYGPSTATGAIVRLNTVYDNGEHGIVISSPNAKVYRNIVYHNSTIENGDGANIKSDGGSSCEIYNNMIYNGNGWNIQILNGATNTKVYSNTCYTGYYTQGGDNYGVNILVYSDDRVDIQNNIFYYYGHGANSLYYQLTYRSPPASPTYILKNNILYASGTSQQVIIYNGTGYTVNAFQSAFSTWASGNIEQDPGLQGGTGASVTNLPTGFNTDWTINNTGLMINLNSPAKDQGQTLGSSYNFDINNTSRPQGSGWDIGAYKFIESATPAPPKNLRLITN